MRDLLAPALAIAALIAAPTALAQTETPAPAPEAPATTAAAPTGATYSDDEITKFATAALAVQKISQDSAMPAADKQKSMVDSITATGLEPSRFNEIAKASQTDTALQQRIAAAVSAQRPPAS